MNPLRVGLRLFEVETALSASEIDLVSSPTMRYFAKSRRMGQALRLAQLIRGMDVISVDRATAIASAQLRIDPQVFDSVIDALEEADLVQRRGDQLYEKVRQVDFAENYERVGGLWLAKNPDGREVMAVGALDELVDHPKHTKEIDAFSGSNAKDRDVVLQITKNAHLVEPIDVGTGDPVLFAPMLWDVDPGKFGQFLKQIKTASIAQVVQAVKQQPAGAELDRMPFDDTQRKLVNRAVTVGLLPTIPVNSTSGERSFSYTPYSGALVRDASERELVDRARAIVSCVRYGERHARYKIRNPVILLTALKSRHFLKAHPELKNQYGQLVKRGIGRIEKDRSNYRFVLIASSENLRALDLALELLQRGEIIDNRATTLNPKEEMALLQPGDIGNEFNGINFAHKQKKATDNEMEELVDTMRGF